eukprot:258453_1
MSGPMIRWETPIYHPSIAWFKITHTSKSQYLKNMRIILSYWQRQSEDINVVHHIEDIILHTFLGEDHQHDLNRQPVFRNFFVTSGWYCARTISKTLTIIHSLLYLKSVWCPVGGYACNWTQENGDRGWTEKSQVCTMWSGDAYRAFYDYWNDREKFLKTAKNWTIKYAQ